MALVTVPRGMPALIDKDMRARRLREADLAQLKVVLAPVVLVPTPAQLARGQRLIDATASQCPSSALIMRSAAEREGWATRVTYSHALMPPKLGGEDWRERHSIALRVEHRARRLRGYAIWENGLWVGAQVGALVETGAMDLLTVRAHGSAAFGDLLADIVREIVMVECRVCRASTPARKDGAPRVHKWVDARCPGGGIK